MPRRDADDAIRGKQAPSGAPLTTRSKLLAGLAEKSFGREQLAEMQKIIDAEKSDLFDVLAHMAYALPPQTRGLLRLALGSQKGLWQALITRIHNHFLLGRSLLVLSFFL